METILKNVILAYKEAIHFTEDNTEEDSINSDSVFSDESLLKIEEDCKKAIDYASTLESNELTIDNSDLFGHDLWLTRNRHGAGFWDGEWSNNFGDKMTEYCHSINETYVYLGDDNLIYFGY